MPSDHKGFYLCPSKRSSSSTSTTTSTSSTTAMMTTTTSTTSLLECLLKPKAFERITVN
jgi:hypothetical protein